jgi:hypothetical protein
MPAVWITNLSGIPIRGAIFYGNGSVKDVAKMTCERLGFILAEHGDDGRSFKIFNGPWLTLLMTEIPFT